MGASADSPAPGEVITTSDVETNLANGDGDKEEAAESRDAPPQHAAPRPLVAKRQGSISLEILRAASPPRRPRVMHNNNGEVADALYSAWKLKHPSALEKFDVLVKSAEEKQIAIFLDYDGTLSPIVENPEHAFMSEAMRAVVQEIAALCPTAIISGRSREKVYDFVKLANLYYAGSHGMDIMGPAISRNGVVTNGHIAAKRDAPEGEDVIFFQPAKEFVGIMNEVFKSLMEKTAGIKGATVENNKFCITVHFRRVEEENWEELAATVEEVVQQRPQLHLTHGRKVMEVRPSLDWHKGKAVSFLLHALGLECKDQVLPLYIGDDRTDEDAFSLLKEKGIGFGILVSSSAKTTSAAFSLRDPPEVMAFLQQLVRWKKAFAEVAREL